MMPKYDDSGFEYEVVEEGHAKPQKLEGYYFLNGNLIFLNLNSLEDNGGDEQVYSEESADFAP
jgi:hypothetical protein